VQGRTFSEPRHPDHFLYPFDEYFYRDLLKLYNFKVKMWGKLKKNAALAQ
jgi:hypothetical protein